MSPKGAHCSDFAAMSAGDLDLAMRIQRLNADMRRSKAEVFEKPDDPRMAGVSYICGKGFVKKGDKEDVDGLRERKLAATIDGTLGKVVRSRYDIQRVSGKWNDIQRVRQLDTWKQEQSRECHEMTVIF